MVFEKVEYVVDVGVVRMKDGIDESGEYVPLGLLEDAVLQVRKKRQYQVDEVDGEREEDDIDESLEVQEGIDVVDGLLLGEQVELLKGEGVLALLVDDDIVVDAKMLVGEVW
jgi:hypothetical protein